MTYDVVSPTSTQFHATMPAYKCIKHLYDDKDED